MCGIALPLLAAFSSIGAQRPAAQVTVGGGMATDERGTSGSAMTITPALGIPASPFVTLGLSGSAARVNATAWQVGGTGAVNARSRARMRTTLFLNGVAGLSHTSFGTTFSVGDASAGASWNAGPLTAFVGGRLASGRTRTRADGAVPVGGATALSAQVRRTLLAPTFGGSLRLSREPAPVELRLGYHEQPWRFSEGHTTDRMIEVTAVAGPSSIALAATSRRGAATGGTFGTASLTVALNHTVSLQMTTGRYPSDLLTGGASGRFSSAALVLQIGAPRNSDLPRPAGVASPNRGLTRLSIRAGDAESVDLYGDWNDWTPIPAVRAGNGVWYVDLPLAAGEYRYAFRINGVAWRVPEGAAVARDGFGGHSAFVVVARGAAQSGSDPREDE